ncbi:MerR family transcriptional regulator [Halioglobus maricola]|uniref:MerR family transcriptional regulator n=1 Tax=Halioglobus maricola TaxID=2601894 RepID=A0A5P9NKU8_9GAMM|nr:MerR family transcriptional regulator [Halioglobus maricola]
MARDAKQVTQIEFQAMPLYGIGTVARLTGVKPDTLRVWERRYSLGASHKSPTGRRQYTQTDLDHLQLVSALVESGTRIGEIAGSDRKTLEHLLDSSTGTTAAAPKPRVIFVGQRLASWLQEHQGYLAKCNAKITASSVIEFLDAASTNEFVCDALVVESTSLGPEAWRRLSNARECLGNPSLMVLADSISDHWREELDRAGVASAEFPPQPTELAYYLAHGVTEKESDAGHSSLSELVSTRPHAFSEKQLRELKEIGSQDSTQLITMVEDLNELETVCASRDGDTWQEAASNAVIYALVRQARWLTERALETAVSPHGRS